MDELKIEHLKGLCIIEATKYLMQKDNISHEEAGLILFFYDKNHDGLLFYDEFIDLIQSISK